MTVEMSPTYPRAAVVPATEAEVRSGKINGFAIASFVLGWVGLFPACLFAIGFGHKALSQINDRQSEGRAFAIGGLVLGYFNLVISLAMLVFLIFIFTAA